MHWRMVAFFLPFCCWAQTMPDSLVPVEPPVQVNSPVKKSWNTIYRGQPYKPMTPEERAQFLLRRVVLSPGAPARAAFLAAFDQRDNDPPGWGQGWDAYGRRVANRWARTAIRNSMETGIAAALGHEQRYIQCNCDGVLRRTAHAIAMNFVTYDKHGNWAPHYSRIGSTVATEYIGLTWLPSGTRTASEATRDLGLLLVTGSLFNIWREFSPPLMRKVKNKIPMQH